MENSKAIVLIDKILSNLDKSGINTTTLVDDIKVLRVFALEQEVPLVVKVLRLVYEHIEANETFLIPIPTDEAVEEEMEIEKVLEIDPIESLKYVILLTRNLKNKSNISDLKEYRDQLNAF